MTKVTEIKEMLEDTATATKKCRRDQLTIEAATSLPMPGVSKHISVGNDSDYLCDVTILNHLLVDVNTEMNHCYFC